MARGAGGAVSDVVHGRLRALLGTSGVERDAVGLSRAIPDSADALSLETLRLGLRADTLNLLHGHRL